MDFFKFLRKKDYPVDAPPEKAPEKPAEAPEAPKEEHIVPELYTGMRLEVLTPENHLLFVGRLKILGNGVLELRSDSGDQLPMVLYQQEVKLRGFQKNSQAFTVTGRVTGNTADFWRVENLDFLQSKDSRAFFRQSADLTANATPSGRYRGAEETPCKILDISAGGVRVLSKKEYDVGDLFLLAGSVIPEESPFTITCQVQRVVEKPHGQYEYGCQFVGLPEKEQERLLQAIFTLQRKMLQARRDRE